MSTASVITFVVVLAVAAAGVTALWWSLARADPSRISTFFIGSAGIILCGVSSIFLITFGVYVATA